MADGVTYQEALADADKLLIPFDLTRRWSVSSLITRCAGTSLIVIAINWLGERWADGNALLSIEPLLYTFEESFGRSENHGPGDG